MSEQPKIEIANLPSGRPPTAPSNPPKTPPPPPPPAPPSRPAPADPPPKANSGLTIGLAVLCLLLIAVAVFHVHHVHQLEAALNQNKDEATQLQNQLAQARNDAKTVQENADKLTQESAALKSQLADARSQYTDAKANLDKMTGQMATMQSQLNEARNAAARSKAAADRASAELARLQAATQSQPEPAPAPAVSPNTAAPLAQPMPLSVSFKKPEVGDGLNLVLQNVSPASLPIRVKFTNPTTGKSKEYQISIDSGASKELGSLGAWKLASGDRISIESGDYAPILRTAP